MTKVGRSYPAVRLSDHIGSEDWEDLVGHFGMHMAFDPDDSAILRDRVNAWGWKIGRAVAPTLFAMYNATPDQESLDEQVVDMALHYNIAIMEKLALGWLAAE